MSSYVKHAPKHRAPKARRAPKAALKTSLTLSSMAVVATGLAVGGGSLDLFSHHAGSSAAKTSAATGLAGSTVSSAGTTTATSPDLADAPAAKSAAGSLGSDAARGQVVTRSESRVPAADPKKLDALTLGSGNAMSRSEDLSDEDPKLIAQALLSDYGWDQDQFGCLDSLWTRESNWNVSADNPSSSAYGIPQALPGSKMSAEGADWATNPVTQIRWGLGYIQDRYGSPCGAWGHSQSSGFY